MVVPMTGAAWLDWLLFAQRWIDTHAFLWWSTISIGLLVILLGGLWVRRWHPLRPSHGTAHFSTRREARAAGLLGHKGCGIVAGRLGSSMIRLPRDMSALVMGPAGSGKSRGVIMPTLRAWPGSAVILDMSGELYDATHQAREAYGPVGVVALTAPESPDALNPLDRIRYRTADEDTDVRSVVEHLRPYDRGPGSQGALYYRDQASNLLTCGLLVVGYPAEGERVMGQAYATTCRGVLEMLAEAPPRVTERLQQWAAMRHETIQLYAQLLLKDALPDQREIWKAAANWLLPWQNPVLVRNTSTTTVPLDRLQHGPQPVTIYLQAPVHEVRGWLGRIVRLIVEQILLAATRHREYTFRWPQLIVLDDMEALGGLHVIQDIPAHYRKYGVTLLGVIQSLGQLWEHFGRETSLLDNCRAWIVFAPQSPTSAEFLVRKLSEKTVMDARLTRSWGRSRGRSRTEIGQARPLLDAGAIMRLTDQHLVCVQGITLLAKGDR
jgi:type IV secretion system protein VirD4